jgi:lysophospholipase L1-like esterase
VPGFYLQDNKPAFWTTYSLSKKTVQVSGTNKILLIGSSSFTNWKDVQDYFPSYPIINRGFGLYVNWQIRYIEDVIYPYKPKQIIIFGENDLLLPILLPLKVYDRFVQLLISQETNNLTFLLFMYQWNQAPATIIDGKNERRQWTDQKISENKKQAAFVDVYKEMIDDEGKPRTELFLDDNLHMNKSGYVWKRWLNRIWKNDCGC